MVPKVHWYMIDPLWTPLWGYMRYQSSKKWQNSIFSGSLEWNHIGSKSFMISNIFISQIQIFPKFLYNWENWELFANFSSRKFLFWFLEFWQTFEWNFGATRHKLFFLHSMEKKSTFLPYHVKKNHSTLEVDTFKVILLLSYLASLDNKPRTWL